MAISRGRIEADVDEGVVVRPRPECQKTVLGVERKRTPVRITVAAETAVWRPQDHPGTVDDRQLIHLVLETVVRAANKSSIKQKSRGVLYP